MSKKSIIAPNRVHIIKRSAGWALKKEGTQRATKVYQTKAAAIEAAQKNRAQGSDVIIHKTNGSIEEWQAGQL